MWSRKPRLGLRGGGCVLALALVTGCIPQRSAVQEDFGVSVRAMTAAATGPRRGPLPALDGEKARNALKVYRENVSKPEKVNEHVIFRVGR